MPTLYNFCVILPFEWVTWGSFRTLISFPVNNTYILLLDTVIPTLCIPQQFYDTTDEETNEYVVGNNMKEWTR